MTTYTMSSVVADNGTAGSGTAIRAWVQKVHDALVAIGMVQTSDTGQANISTLVAPSAAGTAAGYEIWRFNDTLQATAPVFFKLEYGSGSAGASPQMWITVGKGTDGAGNITNVLFARQTGISGGSTSGNPSGTGTGYAASGDGCCIALLPFAEGHTGRYQPGFILERSRTDQGTATADALVLVTTGIYNSLPGSQASAASYQAVNYADTSKTSSGVLPVLVPAMVNGTALATSTSVASGSIGPVWPWIIFVPGIAPFQCLTGMSFSAGDAPSGTFSLYVLGQTRTYRAIPVAEGHAGYGLATAMGSTTFTQNNNIGLAIRWE